MVNIVITGASGFIGNYLVEKLCMNGHELLCLGRENTSYHTEELTAQMRGYDILVHLAGRRLMHDDDLGEDAFIAEGVSMMKNLIVAADANQLKRIVNTSSIGVYSTENNAPYSEKESPVPANAYGEMKLRCEKLADECSIPAAHIRLAQCFGYGEKHSPVLMRFAMQAASGQMVEVHDGGAFPMDEIYIDDAIRAFMLLIESDVTGAFNIGAGHGYSVLDIARATDAVFENDGKLEIEHAPDDTAPEKPRHMDISRAKEVLNWEPEFNLVEGLEAMKKEMKHHENH